MGSVSGVRDKKESRMTLGFLFSGTEACVIHRPWSGCQELSQGVTVEAGSGAATGNSVLC